LEDLSKAIDLAHTQRNIVDNGRVLLNCAHGVQQQYERYKFFQFIFALIQNPINWWWVMVSNLCFVDTFLLF